MKLLLDTHAFLWFISGDAALSGHARALIEDEANGKLVSIGSLWEIVTADPEFNSSLVQL